MGFNDTAKIMNYVAVQSPFQLKLELDIKISGIEKIHPRFNNMSLP